MSIIIKEADLASDRQIMIDLLHANRPKVSRNYQFEARYDWLYLNNPHGLARAWLAIDSKKDEVAGFTVALPREMSVSGNRMYCWNCADFSINKKYRTLGVALQLRKAAKIAVDKGEIPFLYAHPNNDMLPVHQRVGHKAIGKMVRYAKLLNCEDKIKGKLKNRMLSKSISKIGNLMLFLSSLNEIYYKLGKFKIEKITHFNKEFDQLFERMENKFQICGVRDSKYLNWRYVKNPLYSSETYALYIDDVLEGYIIHTVREKTSNIKDIFCSQIKYSKVLLAYLLEEARNHAIQSVSASFLDTNPLINVLKTFNFKYRSDSTSSMIAYSHPASHYSEIILDGANWFITVGDRDE